MKTAIHCYGYPKLNTVCHIEPVLNQVVLEFLKLKSIIECSFSAAQARFWLEVPPTVTVSDYHEEDERDSPSVL